MFQYFQLALSGVVGLASAQAIEYTNVGTQIFGNTKYYPTDCYNSDTGAQTNEFWTYLNPSTQDNRYPDWKDIADPTGSSTWEGRNDVYVIDNSVKTNEIMQVLLSPNAHSEAPSTMVGALYDTTFPAYYPCYVTPAGEMEVDFFNGWVCQRLYTCSLVPHMVSSIVISQQKTSMEVTQRPYESLMAGIVNSLPSADAQIAQIPTYEQTFHDNEGNSYSFTADVINNGPYNLFWTINATAQDYPYLHANPSASAFDEAYSGGTIAGDASFPQSASIVTYVGLDHTSYSKMNFYQTSLSPAPPATAGCSSAGFGIGSGATGALGGILGAVAVLAAPETGGASLALAAGIAAGAAGAASGGLGIAAAAAC